MKSPASMNRIYRLVWNASLGVMVAVAENAKGKGKSGTGLKLVAAALSLAGGFFLAPFAAAEPVGGVVSAGSGSITKAGTTTTINQSSANLAINWQGFSIGANEAVRFNQPSASSVVLNRVVGQSPSQILGSLSANGQVFVLNPNGVLFGKGSQVDVGGLVASTLSLADADLMAGKFMFTSPANIPAGSVVNQGTLTAAQGGYIALLAPEVRNEGVISATLGTAVLAAGNKVTLNLNSNSLLSFSLDEGALSALADNKQLIKADGGQVFMSAKAANALSTAVVNNTGIIEARTLQNRSGKIWLISDMTVGTTNLGGTLDASAPNGGDGGFIETSAAHVKIAEGTNITTAAVAGKSGEWLIDPLDFTVSAAGGNVTGTDLSRYLNNNSITIQTATSGTNDITSIFYGTTGTNGDIFIDDVISWNGATKLTLDAARNIFINKSITASNSTGSLALKYGQALPSANNTANYTLKNAQVSLVEGNNFSTTLGNSTGFTKNYTVITSLGDQIDATTAPTTTTLQGMAATTNLAKNYVLGADITNGSATSTWNTAGTTSAGFTPIGNSTNKFSGTFDGLGHTIKGLKIYRPSTQFIGLFGYVTSDSLRNISLIDINISGGDSTGGLVGSFGSSTQTLGTISNSNVKGKINSDGANIGGLTGITYGSVINSNFEGFVTGTSMISVGYIGGLVGYIPTPASVELSYSKSTVSGFGNNIGGLVGYSGGDFSDSYSTGSVTAGGTGTTVGGLVGSGKNITESYSESTVNATGSTVGGLAGSTTGLILNSWSINNVTSTGSNSNIGGLVGNSQGITGSFATGNVTALNSTQVGGLVGTSNGNILESYVSSNVPGAPNEVKGLSDVGGLVGNAKGLITTSYASYNVIGSGANIGGLIGKSSKSITFSYATGSVDAPAGGNYVGGLVGSSTNGGIANSYATGSVSAAGNYVGGLAGNVAGSVTKSYATGIVEATTTGTGTGTVGGSYVGGLVGKATNITQSYSTSPTVTGLGQYVGGLAGVAGQTSESYYDSGVPTKGIVSGGTKYFGGLIGEASGVISNSYAIADVKATGEFVGGLVGQANNAVSYTYASGTVYGGNRNVGSLIGYANYTVKNSYWWSSGITAIPGSNKTNTGTLKSLLDPDFLKKSSFSAWNIGNDGTGSYIWRIYEGISTPYLTAFMEPLTVTNITSVYNGRVQNPVAIPGSTSAATVTSNAVRTGTAANGTNVGTYQSYSNQLGFNISGGTLTITPAELTLTGSRPYDGTTAVAGSVLTATGVNTENFSVTGTGDASNLSSKNVNGSGSLLNSVNGLSLGAGSGGAMALNYNALSTTGSKVTVTAKELTVTGTTTADSKTYDGTTVATLKGGALSGVVSGEEALVSLNQVGTFASKDVATGITVTAAETLSGTGAGNYKITQPTVSNTADITQAGFIAIKAVTPNTAGRALDVSCAQNLSMDKPSNLNIPAPAIQYNCFQQSSVPAHKTTVSLR